jgi:hypothetical protein
VHIYSFRIIFLKETKIPSFLRANPEIKKNSTSKVGKKNIPQHHNILYKAKSLFTQSKVLGQHHHCTKPAANPPS